MDIDWAVPYLLVLAAGLLIRQLCRWIGRKRGPRPTFAPHTTFLAAGIALLGLLVYLAAMVLAALW